MKYRITAFLFIIILSAAAFTNWMNAYRQREELQQDLKNETELAGCIEDVEDFIDDNLYGKYACIEAYGAIQKALFKRENSAFAQVTDKKGYLHNGNFYSGFGDDQKKVAINIRRLADYASAHGSKFVFAMTPMKLVLEENRYMGIPYNDFTKLADDLLRFLRYYNVSYIDLRECLEKSGLTYDETYYRTDHHWKTAAAFKAYAAIVEWLETEGNLKLYESSTTTDISNYTVVNYENLMLGSQGRAAGKIFAGSAEDFEVYFPKKAGAYQVRFGKLDNCHVRQGQFNEVILNDNIKDLIKDDYKDSSYDLMFLHGLSDYISIINKELSEGSKILMLRDSYASPLGAYLAQNCRQLDLIYMLGDDRDKIRNMISDNDYDYIIMCVYPENLSLDNLQIFEDVEYE